MTLTLWQTSQCQSSESVMRFTHFLGYCSAFTTTKVSSSKMHRTLGNARVIEMCQQGINANDFVVYSSLFTPGSFDQLQVDLVIHGFAICGFNYLRARKQRSISPTFYEQLLPREYKAEV